MWARGVAVFIGIPVTVWIGVGVLRAAPARADDARATASAHALGIAASCEIVAPAETIDPAANVASAANAASARSAESEGVARRAANAARRAVEAGAPDAARVIASAVAALEALPSGSPARLEIELHVLRTRMRFAEPDGARERAASAGDAPGRPGSAERSTIARDLEALASAAERSGERVTRGWASIHRAEWALAEGDRALARRLADVPLSLPEDEETWRLHVEAEKLRSGTFAGDPTQLDEAIRGLARARATLARLRPRLGEQAFLEVARPVHERLAGLLLERAARETSPRDAGAGRSAASTEPGAAASTLREVLAVLEALKLAELRAYFGDACLADLETTTPERLPATLLLYPVVLEDRVELIVGRAGRLERRSVALSPTELVAEARRLRGALQDPTSPRHRVSAERLFEALIRPLEPELGDPSAPPETLVVVPSGVLREIPFAALFDAASKQYLVERIALATLPSLHVLPSEPLDARRLRLLVAGLGEAVEGFSPLPFAARELAAAAERFPATLRFDADFTRGGLAEALEQALFDVVHVASHGRFDARASESFLLAHDGRIGLAELGLLIGRTRHRTGRPLELLVLSACETAIGDERAVLGLAGVAVQAGARSAVASLWKVHDEATMRLFERFYASLGEPGISRAEALRRAQVALHAEPRFRHPIYWSAFLLVNGWR